jgi:hypothetical protein
MRIVNSFVDSRVLIQPIEPIVDHKKIWKMKILLNMKVFTWYLRRGVFSLRTTLM